MLGFVVCALRDVIFSVSLAFVLGGILNTAKKAMVKSNSARGGETDGVIMRYLMALI